jgi:DNA-binding MarR family transcriptional regulator
MSAHVQKTKVDKPRLERLGLVRDVLIGFRSVLDQELQPLGITTAQLRVLWMVSAHTTVSGAEVARLCGLTPQSGHAMISGLEKHGWVKRHSSEKGGRVLTADVTARGRKVLERAKSIAEALDAKTWKGIPQKDLAGMEAALRGAAERLER